ncbi:MAG: hypothetical protein IPP32_13080 [Bacteroidetes bacterium]|nr:hypothetical protein [Bacteroidota bacterium]
MTAHTLCDCCGISLFNSLDAALKKYNTLKPLYKAGLPYTHVAEGKVSKNDGRCTKLNKGHYTLHEFEGASLTNKFSIVQEL